MARQYLVCFTNGNDASTLMVGGEIVLHEGKATRVDEADVLRDAAREAAAMIERIGGKADLALPPDFWGSSAGQT